MTNEQREKIYQWVMDSGLQDVLFYKVKNAKGKQVVMDRFENFEAFVWNVEQEERDACAALCFQMWEKWMDADPSERGNLPRDAEDCAHAIRARGQT